MWRGLVFQLHQVFDDGEVVLRWFRLYSWLFTHQNVIAFSLHIVHCLLIFIARRRSARANVVFPTMPRTGDIPPIILLLHLAQSQRTGFMQASIGHGGYLIV